MRFIDLGDVTPEYSVCADRAILKSHSSADDDTLLIYSRNRPCISVGRFQKIDDVVNIDYVKESGISIVRRISGGSSIYSDANQLTYSLTVSKDRLPLSRNDSFATVCGALVISLRKLGVFGEYKPVNDVLVNGRKISGGAQARSGSAVLQHGSIIINVDENVVSSSLKQVKARSYEGLTSLKKCLGYIPSRDILSKAIMDGFSEVFGSVVPGELSAGEIDEIKMSADLLLI